jgi:hypothetical protein
VGGTKFASTIPKPATVSINSAYSAWWTIPNTQLGSVVFNGAIIKSGVISNYYSTYGLIVDSGTNFHILPAALTTGLTSKIQTLCKGTAGCTYLATTGYFPF